jgi:putative ABC transport system permease protein
MFLRLALSSLWCRKGSALLTLFAISVSVFVLLGVEQIRYQAKSSFGNTVSGIDLIVGARTGDLNLLLYSVFRLGNATSNISWQSYQRIAADPNVAWTIPISLGDSHKGYRVMGTSTDYFTHFHYGQNQALEMAEGLPFSGVFDVVLGSEVARALGYRLGDQLTLAHGLGSTSFARHDDKPFRVSGILAPTGTPVDQTLHVSLEGIEAIHVGWKNGVNLAARSNAPNSTSDQDLTPESITAFMVGLESKMATFRLQRHINTYREEPLQAILPGVTLTELWQMMAAIENILQLISALVLLASLLGLAAMLLASVRERQREIAVMRAIGAPPRFLLALIEAEALVIALAGSFLAVTLLYLSTALAADELAARYSLFIDSAVITQRSISYLVAVMAGTALVTLIPGISAYRSALHQQLAR